MAATVSLARTQPTAAVISTGHTVLSTTMTGVAALLNWAQGSGMVAAPAFCPGNTIASAETKSYLFWFTPRYQAIQRVWAITCRCTDAAANATVTITAGGSSRVFTAGSNRESLDSVLLIEDLSAQSGTAAAVTLTIAAAGKAVIVEQIAAWDMPRPALAIGGDDGGVDLASVAARERIYEGTGLSVGGISDASIAALAACRRVLMQHALPATTADALQVTGTAYANVFTSTTGTTMVLARKLYRADTTGTLSAKVYAKTADTSDIADVRFTTTSGASAVINIPTGSHAAFAWHGAPLTFTADCEDLGTTDGLPGGAWDAMTVEAKVTAGGDILYLASISVWEA